MGPQRSGLFPSFWCLAVNSTRKYRTRLRRARGFREGCPHALGWGVSFPTPGGFETRLYDDFGLRRDTGRLACSGGQGLAAGRVLTPYRGTGQAVNPLPSRARRGAHPLDSGESRSDDPDLRRLEEAFDGVDDAAAADAGGVDHLGRLAGAGEVVYGELDDARQGSRPAGEG